MVSGLNTELKKNIPVLNLEVWVFLSIFVGVSSLTILLALWFCSSRKKSKNVNDKLPISQKAPNPIFSSEIKEIRVDQNSAKKFAGHNGNFVDMSNEKTKNADDNSPSDGSFSHLENDDVGFYASGEKVLSSPSPLSGLPELTHLGWGHWFTLRDLEIATNRFSKGNIIGEGGYGIVYLGSLMNGAQVAIKKLFNNLGQAEKEFRVEVEAIGHVRHKNLVRLLGYCVEGTHRMLVYEYVNNGNLEQWLHGAMREHGYLTWEARMKIIIGTAKALMYLHEAIEPKVVHRDIKASNILLDGEFNAKLSDFGLAKLLSAGKSHITTRVMGTFGYVAPEYANSGLLNEKSDVYSFGVLLLEAITGRDPVDYSRPEDEVNMVDWLKVMVGNRRSEEVVDPTIETKPSRNALKRALLTALRCIDPNVDKRLTMSEVVRLLESEEYPLPREGQRRRTKHAGGAESEFEREKSDADRSKKPGLSKYTSEKAHF